MFIKELLTWKSLIGQLVFKNLKLRYKTTSFGLFWTFLSPLFLAGIYYFVFSVLLRVRVREVPFFLYIICGIFPWQFFQNSVVQGASSLIDNKNLIKESRFPHYIIPFSILLSNGAVFLPSLLLITLVSFFVMKGLSAFLFLLPGILLLHFVITFGAAIIVSILCLKWRNLPHFLELALNFLFYWAPIVYPLYMVKESLPEKFLGIYFANPFTGIVLLYRMALLRGVTIPLEGPSFHFFVWIFPVLLSIGILLFAFTYYKKNRGWINDYLAY